MDATSAPPSPSPSGCTVIMKGGDRFELDLTATRIKHMRRGRQILTIQDAKGEKFLMDCSKIKSIIPSPLLP